MSTDKPYLHPYREAQDQHGADFGVTLWANQRSQHRRFKVFTQMCFFTGKHLLDAGCSRGDFAAFLLENGIEYARYVGIDALDQLIGYAKQRGLRDARFVCGDFLTQPKLMKTGKPQIICISGSLNTMDLDVALNALQSAWDATRETLIFNFLSDQAYKPAPTQGDPARRHDTFKLLNWALSQTWAVQFRHDYFQNGHDATIMMRKP